MKMSGGPASINIKVTLVIIAILIAVGTLYYTQDLVKKLQEKERQIVELYASGLDHIANTNQPDVDITFLFDNIIKPIDFPLILTDAEDNINLSSKSDIRNVNYDTSLTEEQLRAFLAKEIVEMDKIHQPILVTYADSIVLQKIHFGNSELINRLQYYPYLQILIAALFILLGYIGFSNIKRNEQSNIWVGMAKETAHQFGTPLSSLMGWIELLRSSFRDPDKVLDITDEIESDVAKLKKITNRFSKIGATPEIHSCNVYDEVRKVTDYFQRRLPQTGKKVDLKIQGDHKVCADLNSELFEWVIENLVKNALDAIENNAGEIVIDIKDVRNRIEVEVTDTGKGIDLKRRKDVFRPGYSTKRRGWGLGLSLSKRIIESYHKGRIFVKNSIPGEGTTFKIILNKSRNS